MLLILVLFLCAPVLLSQTVDQDDVIRVETDVTNLPFTAMDKQRRFITTLRAEDLRVLEDGVPQKLFTFQQETDRPLAIAFLIDVSYSQESTLPDEKAAARTFIEKVIESNKDQVAIVPFTGLAYLEQPLTRDLLNVYRVLQRIEVAVPAYFGAGRPLTGIPTGPGLAAPPDEGTTAIWDAVALTSSNVLANAAGLRRRAIILLTNAAFAEIERELRTQYLLAYSSTNKKRDGSYRKITIEITNPELKKEKLEIRHRPGYYAK
jgi:Ca-activated chloride channel homolog